MVKLVYFHVSSPSKYFVLLLVCTAQSWGFSSAKALSGFLVIEACKQSIRQPEKMIKGVFYKAFFGSTTNREALLTGAERDLEAPY
jgi:hypothetical protein